ncbi:hypothetical protein Y1Q_0008939 [Alligator mississippiensis]|uniref:Uncharacterized protein n=1 Tax=Alligator mississippiensis TaxID=8496 RepID=A0A151NKA8_ALLMI|nr:hypothetical protein Y1Q_0008939 [Alligator mississippiensis]
MDPGKELELAGFASPWEREGQAPARCFEALDVSPCNSLHFACCFILNVLMILSTWRSLTAQMPFLLLWHPLRNTRSDP